MDLAEYLTAQRDIDNLFRRPSVDKEMWETIRSVGTVSFLFPMLSSYIQLKPLIRYINSNH